MNEHKPFFCVTLYTRFEGFIRASTTNRARVKAKALNKDYCVVGNSLNYNYHNNQFNKFK